MPEPMFAAGDRAIWVGSARMFKQQVRVVAVRNAYLTIMGETPETGRIVYDIDASPRIKGTVFAIPLDQLEQVPDA